MRKPFGHLAHQTRTVIKGVKLHIVRKLSECRFSLFKLQKNLRTQAACLQIMCVFNKGTLHMCQCFLPVAAAAADGSKIVKGHFLLRGAPNGFVKCVERFFLFVLIQKGKAKAEIRLAIPRVGVFPCGAFDGSAEMRFSFGKACPSQQQHSVGGIQANIARIAVQPFQVIVLRKICCMEVLFKVLFGEVQLLAGGNFCRFERRLCRSGHGFDVLFRRRTRKNGTPVGIGQCQGKLMCKKLGENVFF